MRRTLAAVLLVAALAAGCTTGSRAGAAGPRYVIVGASDAKGFGADDPEQDSWPQLLLHHTFEPGSGLVNVAVPGDTVADALAHQDADAVNADAKAAFVWLAVNDLLHLVPPATYEQQLRRLVHDLRRGGRTRVLVANVPPLDHLPAYLACRNGGDCLVDGPLPPPEVVNAAVDAYNAAVARVATAEGADLVDLHAAGVAARRAGTEASLVSADGFHPSNAGHKLIADAFARVLETRGVRVR
ncbi:MAG TPA: GDSL-type esterase/lipase family protein [Acidimicrobiales bacterium]|nr:GDSL-type esterase/lipase family protein [Acidimicrobiales bacterium]